MKTMKKTTKTTKTNKISKSNKTIKVYDCISHRSYSIKSSDVNITLTRQFPGQLFLHKSNKTRLPYGDNALSITPKAWKKFNRGHRDEW